MLYFSLVNKYDVYLQFIDSWALKNKYYKLIVRSGRASVFLEETMVTLILLFSM